MHYIQGKLQTFADTLSRASLNVFPKARTLKLNVCHVIESSYTIKLNVMSTSLNPVIQLN